MTHDVEYHDAMIKMLEFIWGDGYMAPGGPRNVSRLMEGTEPKGKRILDIGCGIGGPAMDMVRVHGAEVVGIDLEEPLIDLANTAAQEAGLDDRCTFQTVTLGPLPFEDESFDIVTSSGAITQSDDKGDIFDDCYRVLKPGGHLTCYEWMKSEREYSDDMYYWFKMEGLTYTLESLEQYGERLRASGFEDVTTTDASDWYRAEVRREYELIKGDLYEKLVQHIGKKDADHFVENWRAMVVVCESGEMRQGYCRGQKAPS